MSIHDITDTRRKAGAILSGRKLQMLEEAGLTVVEKRRLEVLERLEEAAHAWRAGMIDRMGPAKTAAVRKEIHAYNAHATRLLVKAIDELEAMEWADAD